MRYYREDDDSGAAVCESCALDTKWFCGVPVDSVAVCSWCGRSTDAPECGHGLPPLAWREFGRRVGRTTYGILADALRAIPCASDSSYGNDTDPSLSGWGGSVWLWTAYVTDSASECSERLDHPSPWFVLSVTDREIETADGPAYVHGDDIQDRLGVAREFESVADLARAVAGLAEERILSIARDLASEE